MKKSLVLTAIFASIALIQPTQSIHQSPPREIVERLMAEYEKALTQKPVATGKEPQWTDAEAEALAKMLWGEARGVQSDTEKAAVIWCVLNRVDAGYGDILTVITAPYQFSGYSKRNPVDDNLKDLVEDVLSRWYAEKDGETDVGRVLPKDYLWFNGSGGHNHFRNKYSGGSTWNWDLESPYES